MQKMIDVTSGTFDHTVYILDFLRGEGLRGAGEGDGLKVDGEGDRLQL